MQLLKLGIPVNQRAIDNYLHSGSYGPRFRKRYSYARATSDRSPFPGHFLITLMDDRGKCRHSPFPSEEAPSPEPTKQRIFPENIYPFKHRKSNSAPLHQVTRSTEESFNYRPLNPPRAPLFTRLSSRGPKNRFFVSAERRR